MPGPGNGGPREWGAGTAGDAGDGFIQDAAAAYPLIGSGGRRN